MKQCAMIIMTLILTNVAMSETVSIYDIQYPPADANGLSPMHGEIVDCVGTVVYVTAFKKPRIILYDGVHYDGWGGIILKDWTFGLRDNPDIVPGNEVHFQNVEVEDYAGTTFLQYGKDGRSSSYSVIGTDSPLPEVIPVRVGELEAPVEGPVDQWPIDNHDAECYEGMFVKVIDVNVVSLDQGKALDNYALTSNVDPNTCWAVDNFTNEDLPDLSKYHELVQIGQVFCGVTGFVEQYTATDDGIFFDYYQIVTTVTSDFLLEQIGDLDGDCAVNLSDFAILTEYWLAGTYWD